MNTTLLGGLTPQEFLSEYWQKKPLLIRQAVPSFSGFLDREDMAELARDPDVESRLVRQRDGQWEVIHGPQRAADLKGKKAPWTVLVQGVNLFIPDGDTLLRRFQFIPQARLDDLMVSYAVDGGGVGPHFDNYDVFLLQGMGQRRWQISDQQDRSLIEGAPLRILKHFEPVYDWVLEPGDMLYLPPHWAHNGIAVGECTTYSIGFRSPTAQELATEFLGFLSEEIHLEGLYADPDLQLQQNSAEICDTMVDQVAETLARISWDRDLVARFLGRSLSEPKPTVFFEPPEDALTLAKFKRAQQQQGLALDARTLLLFQDGHFFINGEELDIPGDAREWLATLADQRRQPPANPCPASLEELAYDWYCAGFVHPAGS